MDSIRKACLLISYSNGGVHRGRSERAVKAKIGAFLALLPYADALPAIDTWLATLNSEQLETVCDGEQSERDAIMSNAPPFANQLLDDWFEIC